MPNCVGKKPMWQNASPRNGRKVKFLDTIEAPVQIPVGWKHIQMFPCLPLLQQNFKHIVAEAFKQCFETAQFAQLKPAVAQRE